MAKQYHYGRNIFFICLFLFAVLGIFLGHVPNYDYLTYGYNGAIMPLQVENSSSVTCQRNTNLDVKNQLFIEDEYILKNNSSKNKKMKLYYPIYSSFQNEPIDIQLNNQSIDYQIQLSAILDNQDYQKSQDYFNNLETFINTPFSKELEKQLDQKVYLYEFVNRRYPKQGHVRYLKVQYTTHPQVLYFNMENKLKSEDPDRDNLYYINMNNEEFALTPRLISLEKISDIQMTGYTDNSCLEIDPHVTAEIIEKEVTLRQAIITCIDEYMETYVDYRNRLWIKETIYKTYFQYMNVYFQEHHSVPYFDLQTIFYHDTYSHYYNELEIPANTSITIKYTYEMPTTNIHNEDERGLIHYMTHFHTDLNFTKQIVSMTISDHHRMEKNDMGLKNQSYTQSKPLPLHQDKFYIKIKK